MSRQPTAPETPIVRCVIYTRKSVQEGLDQQFNSLDAQREACESYARSQAHRGWQLVGDSYDDGGYSGGTTDRPAFQRLMADARAGKFDCILIYKLDRFSRSIRDFTASLAELDKLKVAIVSITQQLDTSTSMGKLLQNILLSFSQFERELTAERTRDKKAATRRKGLWVGGLPLLGYNVDAKTKRLVINPSEASRVRAIFEWYVKHGSLLPVVRELNRRGWHNKQWTTRKERQRGGKPFSRTSLYRLLTNVTYIGQVSYKDEVHPGEHDGIIDHSLWQQVQNRLRHNGSPVASRARNSTKAVLKGILRCKNCDCSMVPSHTVRGSKRYRYYCCSSAQRRGWDTCPSKSVPAGAVEGFVVERLRCLGQDPAVIRDTLAQALQLDQQRRAGLEAELRGVNRDLDAWRKDVRQLVSNRAAPGLAGQLAELQERIAGAERRAEETRRELADIDANPIDEYAVESTLARFDPTWEALTPAERAELIDLLIARIEYDGALKKISVTFHPTGLRAFTNEHAQGACA